MVGEPLDWDAFRESASEMSIDLNDRQVGQFQRMLEMLRASNRSASLTSEASLADALRVHFLDSLTLAPIIRELGLAEGRLVDVGTGGGFPGLPLKIALPGLALTLIDATRKKTEHLERTAAALDIEVGVLQARAEDAAHGPARRESFDLATGRALGPWPVVLELALPFCVVGGFVLGQRGAGGPAEASAHETAAATLGGRTVRVDEVGAEAGLPSRHVILVEKIGPTPPRYPRKAGIPAKRPLL